MECIIDFLLALAAFYEPYDPTLAAKSLNQVCKISTFCLKSFFSFHLFWSLLCNENKKQIERRQLSWLIWISRLELQFERRPARNAPIKRLEITLSWVASAWRWPAYRRKNWSQLISFNVRRLLQKKTIKMRKTFVWQRRISFLRNCKAITWLLLASISAIFSSSLAENKISCR